MHLSSMHKYVIISITYLTPKPVKVCLGSQSLRLCIREDGDRHCPKTQPPTPFPYDASNQATCNLYMNITTSIRPQNRPLQAKSRFFPYHRICQIEILSRRGGFPPLIQVNIIRHRRTGGSSDAFPWLVPFGFAHRYAG